MTLSNKQPNDLLQKWDIGEVRPIKKADKGKVGQVEEIVVIKDFRGKSIGTKLIDSLIKEAKKKNCIELQLYSNLKRKNLINFTETSDSKTQHMFFGGN